MKLRMGPVGEWLHRLCLPPCDVNLESVLIARRYFHA